MAPPEEATRPQTVPGSVMPKRGAWIRPVTAGLGAFLIVLGLLLRFYAAPRLVAAPPGFSIVISLVAPHASYFDESTLSTQHDATLTYNDTIRGDAAAGTATIAVWDQFTVLEDLGRNVQLIATFQRSAFNRRTGELTNCCGASVNDDTQVRQDGIGVVFWPIGTQKTTYQVYDTNTERAWPAAYSGTDIVQGLFTYRFTQRIPATVVQQMPDVPTSLLGLPGPSRNVVADRTFQASNTFWVDPRTGVPIKAEEQIRSVLRGPGGKGSLLAADADLTMSPASQRALAAVARGNAASIAALRQTGPLGGLILGALLLLAGTLPVGRLRRVPIHRLPRRTPAPAFAPPRPPGRARPPARRALTRPRPPRCRGCRRPGCQSHRG
jgi:Porin PorA